MDTEIKTSTVFRSADPSAEDDARAVRDLLLRAGLRAELHTDDSPGVPIGAFEVRVPSEEEVLADRVIRDAENAPVPPVDDSHNLDLETLYEGVGTSGEVEAMSIRSLLDSTGIPNVMVSAPQYPNLPFLVKVPRAYIAQAKAAIEEAKRSGPAAAEAAEELTEPRTR